MKIKSVMFLNRVTVLIKWHDAKGPVKLEDQRTMRQLLSEDNILHKQRENGTFSFDDKIPATIYRLQ